MKRVLITGSEGFIGRHMAQKYDASGWFVQGCDNELVDYTWTDTSRVFEYTRASDFDLVIHCAATVGGRAKIEGDPLAIATNLNLDTELFRWALRAGEEAPRVAYFSSSAAYPIRLQTDRSLCLGTNGYAWEENTLRLRENDILLDDTEEPDAMYGWVKLTGERLAAQAQREGLRVHVFRPFSGYGADQSLDYPFPSFIQRALREDDPFQIWGTGEARRDWIHVDDVVEAVYRVVEEDTQAQAGPLNLCTGVATRFDDLADMVTYHADYFPTFVFLKDKPEGVMHRVGDPTRMNQFYTARIDLEEGIKRAIGGIE